MTSASQSAQIIGKGCLISTNRGPHLYVTPMIQSSWITCQSRHTFMHQTLRSRAQQHRLCMLTPIVVSCYEMVAQNTSKSCMDKQPLVQFDSRRALAATNTYGFRLYIVLSFLVQNHLPVFFFCFFWQQPLIPSCFKI